MSVCRIGAWVIVMSLGLVSPLTAFDGSVQISLDQRFFDDPRFGSENDFSGGFVPEIQILFGLKEWSPARLEAILGFSYLQNTSPSCAVLSDGRTCIPNTTGSEDRIEARLFTILSGLKWMAYSPDRFPLVPYIQALATYRYGRLNRQTLAVDAQKKNSGGDFGAQLESGLYLSFFFDPERRSEMQSQWALKDFGMNLHGRYLPAGWSKHGLGLVSGTGGWSFGTSLILDW